MSRVPGLDLLRAVAILWVMYYHAEVIGVMTGDHPVADFGWMGVDLFFVLSGYLIGGQLFRPYARGLAPQPGRFYARRLLRTLPAYLVVVGLYFTWPAFNERAAIQPLWQFLTFTENLLIDFSHPKSFSHVWSLCVEEQFYLVAPLVVWLALRRPAAWKGVAICAAVLVGGMLLRAWIWGHDIGPIQHLTEGPGNVFQRYQERIYYPTWTRLDGLLAGVVLAMVAAFRPDLWRRVLARGNALMAVGLVMVAVSIWLLAKQRDFIPTVFGYPLLSWGLAALTAAAASPTSLLGRWRIPGAGWIAAMAYSLYLTHKQVYHMVHVAVGTGLDDRPVLAVAAYAGAALSAGALLYFAVERPFLKLRDRLDGARGPGPIPAAEEPAL